MRFPRRFSTLAMIALVAIALRAFAFARMVEPPHVFHGDPKDYTDITAGLLDARWDHHVWIYPPGYPLLALPFAPILGPGWSLVLVSALAGVALPLLLLALRRHVAHAEQAAWASLLVAIYPEAVFSTARALSEASTLLLLAAMVILFEASQRASSTRKQRLLAVAAGLSGGLGALSRPEAAPCIPLLVLFALALPARRQRLRSVESAALLTTAALVVLAPYVISLHDRSGVWGLSLKAYLNVKKGIIQSQAESFVERRTIWDHYIDTVVMQNGELDPKRIVEGIDLRDYFVTPRFIPLYLSNLKAAWVSRAPLENALLVFGVAGLVAGWLRGKKERREALLAAITGVPFLAVPILFPPVERYGLVALPAFAWGAGGLLARGLGRLQGRAVGLAASGGLAAIFTVAGAIGVERGSRGFHWTGRKYEFQTALFKGNLDTAELFVKEGLEVDPKNPEVYQALGDVRVRRGDEPGAFAAFDESLRRGGDRLQIAYSAARTGEPDSVEAILAPLRANPPQDPKYWLLEGHLAVVRGDSLAALERYDRAESLGADAASLAEGRSRVRREPEAR